MTGEAGAWDGKRYGMPRDRFGEHTADGIRAQFSALDATALEKLTTLPALLAYEKQCNLSAHVARITRIQRDSSGELRFDHEPVEGIPPIPPDRILELAWELDIGQWEMNRTHWAIKDIDLAQVLSEAGIASLEKGGLSPKFPRASEVTPTQLVVAPSVFAIPVKPRDPRLVAVMMPFTKEFDTTYQAIKAACTAVGLSCEKADDVWDAETVIQDIFDLIYRSAITVVDLSGRNSNVMYETGIAHTLGRPVVPISRSVDSLPFDLAHHRTLPYLPNIEGLAEMQTKLERRLRTLLSR